MTFNCAKSELMKNKLGKLLKKIPLLEKGIGKGKSLKKSLTKSEKLKVLKFLDSKSLGKS